MGFATGRGELCFSGEPLCSRYPASVLIYHLKIASLDGALPVPVLIASISSNTNMPGIIKTPGINVKTIWYGLFFCVLFTRWLVR